MAFAVFGRGRALFAQVGKGITEQNIEEDCTFLIGPCGCEVKRANPGTDLLIAADWSTWLERIAMPAQLGQELIAMPALIWPEPIAMPVLIEEPLKAVAVPESILVPRSEPPAETSLFSLFLVLVAGLVGTVAIALTMTRWRRV
jgi:hypothetical protein